jgi:hypothetical protein
VVIEDDLVSVERLCREREGRRIEIVRMNHANGFFSGNGAHFHEESGEFEAGNRSMSGAVVQIKFFRVTIEEKKERFQPAGRIQVLKLAKDPGAIAGLM